MTRAELYAYLDGQLSKLSAEAGLTLDDTPTGYGPAINSALRRMGYTTDTDPVPESLALAGQALAAYYHLSHIARQLATRVDYLARVNEGDREQIFDNVRRLIELAKEDAAGLGYAPNEAASAATFGILTVTTDHLEPRRTA